MKIMTFHTPERVSETTRKESPDQILRTTAIRKCSLTLMSITITCDPKLMNQISSYIDKAPLQEF